MAAADGWEPLPWPPYRILGVTALLEELRINRRLAHLHLTQGSLEALESVADLEPAKISDLAALMSVSKQSLGKLLCRLESLGLLSKERGSDARSTSITLTSRGRTILITAENCWTPWNNPVPVTPRPCGTVSNSTSTSSGNTKQPRSHRRTARPAPSNH